MRGKVPPSSRDDLRKVHKITREVKRDFEIMYGYLGDDAGPMKNFEVLNAVLADFEHFKSTVSWAILSPGGRRALEDTARELSERA